MLNKKVDKFLDEHNLKYVFVILAGLESKRLMALPKVIKDSFTKNITEISMDHIYENNFPEYDILSIEENEK